MFKLKKSLLNKLIFILLFSFTLIDAAKGPQYNSTRVRGMGGAFVAVADNKDALYYNPAGLNLMNRFGNFEKNPDMGYLPRERFEFKLFSVSALLPSSEITYVQNVCGTSRKITLGNAIKSTLLFDFDYFNFGDIEFCPTIMDIFPDDLDYMADSLKAHPELADSLVKIDRKPIEIGVQVSVLELAMHNFGLAIWANTSVAPWIESGVLMPYFGYEPVQLDAVAQTAAAFSPVDNWSVGVGLKLARRAKLPNYEFIPTIYEESLDTLYQRRDDFVDELLKFDNINFALDFGVLYQLTREVRLGTSLRNVFFSDLADESITPNLSIGAAYSPMILQSNDLWGRKVNFAMDYADIMDGTVGDMFFSHLKVGAEIDQVILPSPIKNMPILWRALFGAVGGAVGGTVGYLVGGDALWGWGGLVGLGIGSSVGADFGSGGDLLRGSLGFGLDGGYWAATGAVKLSAVEARFSSYAEESGLRTGQKEQRFWAFEVSAGF